MTFLGDLEQEGRTERWVVASSQASEERAEKTLRRKMEKERKRWVFQQFEGIELLIIRSAESVSWQVLRLKPVHERILRLLGLTFEKIYGLPN